jgi:hypothetical protein
VRQTETWRQGPASTQLKLDFDPLFVKSYKHIWNSLSKSKSAGFVSFGRLVL